MLLAGSRLLFLNWAAGSGSSLLFLNWGLSRGVIKRPSYKGCRIRQTRATLARILTKAHFEFFPRDLQYFLPAQCQRCQKPDSSPRILDLVGCETFPRDPNDVVSFLGMLAIQASVVKPHVPTPIRRTLVEGIGLEFSSL